VVGAWPARRAATTVNVAPWLGPRFRGDLPAVPLHSSFTMEASFQASHLSRGGIGLPEPLEDVRQEVREDPDAGVAH
jgi:hypothetical protein